MNNKTSCCVSLFPKNKAVKSIISKFLHAKKGFSRSQDHVLFTCLQVLRTALGNRLAKVQGFLFRAAFLRRVPLFLRLISENILLCFLLSTMHSTSKYITGTLSLRFRKILTKLIHSHYFEVDTLKLYVKDCMCLRLCVLNL